VIKYIGSKRTLVPRIVEIASAVVAQAVGATRLAIGRRGAAAPPTACDLFCGTTRVAQGLKNAGFVVTANDAATYAEVLATTYVEADARRVRKRALAAKVARLNALPGRDGYVTRMFCEESRYFQPFNGRRIDAIREEIERVAEGRVERAILLTSLMEAADRVDSTTGLQCAGTQMRSQRPWTRWTWPTSTRRTTSIRTIPTTTSGKRWCGTTRPRHTGSRGSAPTVAK
jgi:adenine-specific DNA-methyltransferase